MLDWIGRAVLFYGRVSVPAVFWGCFCRHTLAIILTLLYYFYIQVRMIVFLIITYDILPASIMRIEYNLYCFFNIPSF